MTPWLWCPVAWSSTSLDVAMKVFNIFISDRVYISQLRDFPGGQVVKNSPSSAGTQVWSLGGELRSQMQLNSCSTKEVHMLQLEEVHKERASTAKKKRQTKTHCYFLSIMTLIPSYLKIWPRIKTVKLRLTVLEELSALLLKSSQIPVSCIDDATRPLESVKRSS